MPSKFWLLGYCGLLWDRTIMGFVPISVLRGKITDEDVKKYAFLSELEVNSQIDELNNMGLSKNLLTSKGYRLG